MIEDGTNNRLEFATVYVEVGDRKVHTITDERGKFRIKPLEPGSYTLHADFLGKKEVIITDIDVRKDAITRVEDIMMTPDNELPPLTIRWIPPVINFEEIGKMTVKGGEIRETALAQNPIAFVASLGDGIVQQDAGQPLYIRGGRADAVKYIVDGMNVRDGIKVPSRGIGELSVYTSGIPAKYGDVLSGVIVIETKSYFDLYNEYNN